MNNLDQARARRLDAIICDRIETLINHSKTMEEVDPELAEFILLEALHFAQTIDEMNDDDSIFWALPIRPA